MTLYTAEQLDLSRLPQVPFVTVDEDAQRLSLIAGIQARFDARGVPYTTGMLRSEPIVEIAEEFAFRMTQATQQINDAVAGQYLATSFGARLDHLAKTLYPDQVLLRNAGELDEPYKRRIALGSEVRAPLTPGAYLHTALAYSTDVADALVLNWSSGLVRRGENLVVVLGKPGVDEIALCAGISEAIRTRPIKVESDTVIVRPAARRRVAIGGTLYLPAGPDGDRVRIEREAAVLMVGARRRKVGRTVSAAALSGAMSSDLVERVGDITVDGTPLMGDLVPPLDGVIEIASVSLAWRRLDG